MKKTSRILSRRIACAGALGLTALVFALQVHAGTDSALVNPLKSPFDSIPGFISGVLKIVVMIALPIITLLFVVVGYKFVSAQGNTSKLDEAKKDFWYAVLGALLIMGAWVLATIIANTVTQLVS